MPVAPRLLPLVEETRAFYATRVAGRGPSSWAELQALRAAVSPPPGQVEVVSGVPLRIHRPDGAPRGVLLELHGGGFYLGSTSAGDARNRALADALSVVVVSVDYRLAPEHPWPAAPDDCETAALWLVSEARALFGTGVLAVIGFSAGATLAMTTLLRLRDRGLSFGPAVLQFGTYDLSGSTPAGRLIADEYFLEAYLGSTPDRTVPDISPVFADLTGLPPVLMVVGEDDVLLPDNQAMAARLAAAGVDVDLRVYPASPHGFTGHPTLMAEAARADIETWLGDHLGNEVDTPIRASSSPSALSRLRGVIPHCPSHQPN